MFSCILGKIIISTSPWQPGIITSPWQPGISYYISDDKRLLSQTFLGTFRPKLNSCNSNKFIYSQGFPTQKNGRAINHARSLFCARAFARTFCECSQSLLGIFCDYCKSSPPQKCGSENCNRSIKR